MDTMVEDVVADAVATEEEVGAAVEEEVEEEDPETTIGSTRHKGQLLLEIKDNRRQEVELFDNFCSQNWIGSQSLQ